MRYSVIIGTFILFTTVIIFFFSTLVQISTSAYGSTLEFNRVSLNQSHSLISSLLSTSNQKLVDQIVTNITASNPSVATDYVNKLVQRSAILVQYKGGNVEQHINRLLQHVSQNPNGQIANNITKLASKEDNTLQPQSNFPTSQIKCNDQSSLTPTSKANNFVVYQAFRNYVNLSINYPSNWTFVEEFVGYPYGTILTFFPCELGKNFVNFQLKVYPLYGSQAATSTILLNQKLRIYSESYHYEDFKVISSSVESNSAFGNNAYEIRATYNDKDFGQREVYDSGSQFDDLAYHVLYDASASEFDKYLPLVQEMIRSLKISDTYTKRN